VLYEDGSGIPPAKEYHGGKNPLTNGEHYTHQSLNNMTPSQFNARFANIKKDPHSTLKSAY
jgi:hypothetical protein